MSLNNEKILEMLEKNKTVICFGGTELTVVEQSSWNTVAEQILSASQSHSEIAPPLQQAGVSGSVEFEKPQPTLSADEIKATAEMLWGKPMKLEAVKMIMKLGYSLKDAKAYCELHFG